MITIKEKEILRTTNPASALFTQSFSVIDPVAFQKIAGLMLQMAPAIRKAKTN